MLILVDTQLEYWQRTYVLYWRPNECARDIIIIIIIILESAVQGRDRVRTLSVQRPQPHTTNPWKEEKDKTVGDKKERADHVEDTCWVANTRGYMLGYQYMRIHVWLPIL